MVWDQVARMQARRRWWVLGAAAILTALLGILAVRLFQRGVLAGFEHLLPDGRPSVTELERVSKRTSGVSTLFVVLEAPPDVPVDRERLRAGSDAVTKELRALGDPWVGSADNGLMDALPFFERYGALYAKKPELEQLSQDAEAYYRYYGQKELGLLLDDDAPPPPQPFEKASLERRFGVDQAAIARYPDGYFESPDGRVHVIAIRSKVVGGDLARGRETLEKVREAIDRAGLEAYQPGMRIGFAGDLYSGTQEVEAINHDVTNVGLLGACLLAGVVLVYYLRLRTLIILLSTILVGLTWTAAVASVAVVQLNTATGFVFTIIAGTGVNTGIIYMNRYLEGRRHGESVERAVALAHRETFLATLCAAAASSAAFLSLCLTPFRGFRELGLIGGVGLTLCWIATLWVLPPMLAVVERRWPVVCAKRVRIARMRAATERSFGKPFAFLVKRFARGLALCGVGIGIIGFAALGYHVANDPYEHDMRRLRTDPTARMEDQRYKQLAESVTGYVSSDTIAIVVDDAEQIGPLREVLEAKRDSMPEDLRPFDRIVTLQDFLPADQQDKIPIIDAIKKRIDKAHTHHAFSDQEWNEAQRFLPPDDLRPIGLADLPDSLARPFSEIDGTRGRVVYIAPTSEDKMEDARYLVRWANSYRKSELPDGTVVLGSGRGVIYADMWSAVIGAVPLALIASFLAVAAVVMLTFRAGRPALLVMGSLAIGIGWMSLAFAILDLKLNFMNFIALPLTFGIGVDYAVNIVWRATHEGPGGALKAVRETGGAVVLASLTTTFGYLALVGSMNFAVRSLGIAAVLGEVSTLLAAMLVLPAALTWLERRRARPARPVRPANHGDAGAPSWPVDPVSASASASSS